MIDTSGHLRCDSCGKEHALKLEGKLEWYCPRCRHFNRESNIGLDKEKKVVYSESKVE